MRPSEPQLLTATEIVFGRPFTDPDKIQADFAALEQIRAALHATVRAMPVDPEPGLALHLQQPDGRAHRIVILNRLGLLASAPMAVVGFFGQRRPEADPAMLQDLDAELIEELQAHPSMLSYSSCELNCGGWANLVVLADPQGARRWRESARHVFAASQVAPRYYATVRIHNGALPAGLASPTLLHVRTLYYDFADTGWWQAIRSASHTG